MGTWQINGGLAPEGNESRVQPTCPLNRVQKQRGKTLTEIWNKGELPIGRGEQSELLVFLSGYFAAFGTYG